MTDNFLIKNGPREPPPLASLGPKADNFLASIGPKVAQPAPVAEPEIFGVPASEAQAGSRHMAETIPDVLLGAAGGVRDFGQAVLDTTHSLAEELDKIVPLGSVNLGEGPTFEAGVAPSPVLPDVPSPKTKEGQIARGVSSYLVGLIPAFRMARALGFGEAVGTGARAVGMGSKGARTTARISDAMLAGQLVDQVMFDPEKGNLSNLLRNEGGLRDPVTEYLAVDGDDTEIEGRLKTSLEGLGLGALLEPFMQALKLTKVAIKSTPPHGAPPSPSPAAEMTYGRVAAAMDERGNPTVSQAPEGAPAAAPAPPPSPVAEAIDEFAAKMNDRTELGTHAGNIKLDRITSSDEAKKVLDAAATTFAGRIDEARRGVISYDQTRRLADDLGMKTEDLLKRNKGEAFNAEQALSARMIMVASAEDLAKKSKAAVGGTDEDILAFQQALNRHVAIQEQVAGMTAEAGRALSQFNIRATGATRAKLVKDIITSTGGRARWEDIAQKMSQIDDPAALAKFSREARKATVPDMIFEGWINALLSGPRTHAVNTLSNAMYAIWSVPETAAAAGIRKLTGGEGVYFREVMPRLFGLVEGTKDGLRAAAKVLRTGEPDDVVGKVEQRSQRAIPGIVGEVARLPSRALTAEDAFFRAWGYRMSLNQLAMRDGLNKGLTGRALAEHVADVKANPSQEMAAAAHEQARYQTFTAPLGEIGSTVMAIKNRAPGLRYITPFIRTPTNLIKSATERTPLGFVMKSVREDIAAGGARRDTALGRMALGSGIGATAVSLAHEGLITGSGPADPEAKAMLRASGWQPFSIKIGDKYYSYARFEPASTILGLAADFAEVAHMIGDDEAEKIAGYIVGSVFENLTSKTFLTGIADLMQVATDPDRYGQSYIASLAGTLVPTGVAQIAQTQDPVLRDARTTLDRIRSRLPGFSEDIPARVNVWGEPIIREDALGPDIASPVFTSTDRKDPVTREMIRLKVSPSMPDRKIGGIELEAGIYHELAASAGQATKRALDVIMARPDWKKLPDGAKKDVIAQVFAQVRRDARLLLQLKHPEIAREGLAAQVKEYSPNE